MAGKEWTSRIRNLMEEYAYGVTIAAVIAVMAGAAIYTKALRSEQEAGVQAAAEAQEIRETIKPTEMPTPMPTIAPLVVSYAPIRRGGDTVWPVSGACVRVFDAQNLVLWEALSCYQVHTGLDIAGEPGEDVRCAMDGVVDRVAYDRMWGWRITVDQMDGSRAVYAGLQTCAAAEGQSVTRGQALGTLVDAIPCEAELGTHLHMELSRDGVWQDPESMMPEKRAGGT